MSLPTTLRQRSTTALKRLNTLYKSFSGAGQSSERLSQIKFQETKRRLESSVTGSNPDDVGYENEKPLRWDWERITQRAKSGSFGKLPF